MTPGPATGARSHACLAVEVDPLSDRPPERSGPGIEDPVCRPAGVRGHVASRVAGSKMATHSMWWVMGKASKARSERSAHPRSLR